MYYKFEGKKLRAIIETATAKGRKMPYTGEKAKSPGVWLVHDAGVYLMPANREKVEPVYAMGWSPEDGDLVGDDFAEYIPLSMSQLSRIKRGGSLEIMLSDDSMRITA